MKYIKEYLLYFLLLYTAIVVTMIYQVLAEGRQ